MGLSVEAYARQLKQLLPPGRLWKVDVDSWLSKTFLAISEELARIDQRCDDLINESDPRTALETLDDWEKMLGLPDSCLQQIPESVSERRAAIVTKYTTRGGQSIAFYVALAARLGYTATITEFGVARAGRARCGDRCGKAWAFAWSVNVESSLTEARAGTARCGDRVRGFGDLNFECAMARAAPAHTQILFSYAI